eukprot:EG_transcript_12459
MCVNSTQGGTTAAGTAEVTDQAMAVDLSQDAEPAPLPPLPPDEVLTVPPLALPPPVPSTASPPTAEVHPQPAPGQLPVCEAGMQPACRHRGAGSLRIACVGDSLTAYHHQGQAYPWHLEQYLRPVLPNVTVGNFGLPSSTAMLNTDRPYVQSKDWTRMLAFKPQLVVLLFGLNDSKRRNWLRAGGAKQFYRELRALVLNFQKDEVDVVIGQPYRSFKENTEIQWDTVTKYVNPMVRRLACERRLPLFSLPAVIGGKGKYSLTDGVHPTEKGRTAMGRLVADTVLACLRGRPVVAPGPGKCLDFHSWEKTCLRSEAAASAS